MNPGKPNLLVAIGDTESAWVTYLQGESATYRGTVMPPVPFNWDLQWRILRLTELINK